MNRYKKEEARAHREARAGKTQQEIEALDKEDALQARINELARTIHIERFPEEYDHYYDSIEDAKERSRGKNPMSKDYIEKITAKRKELGVEPLADNGMPVASDTWELALREAEIKVRA